MYLGKLSPYACALITNYNVSTFATKEFVMIVSLGRDE